LKNQNIGPRFLVGFNIGCVPQSVTLFAEFLPTKQRAKCVVLLVITPLIASNYFNYFMLQILPRFKRDGDSDSCGFLFYAWSTALNYNK
jgi:hypothetical protein